MTVKIQMLDDTQEAFEVPGVTLNAHICLRTCGPDVNTGNPPHLHEVYIQYQKEHTGL